MRLFRTIARNRNSPSSLASARETIKRVTSGPVAMASLSEASLQSLSGAVGLEGTGRPFKTPLLYYLVIGALVTPIRSFTDVRFHGLGRIPSSGPAIIVCNHISIFDGIFKTQAVRRPVHYLSKKENFVNPFLRFVMTSTGQIETSRQTGAPDAMARAVDVLDAGIAIGIFPEGTRSRKTEPPYLQRGKTGAARLAARFPHVPMVPMVMIGTREMMTPEKKLIKPWKRVEVNIDEPITFAQWAADPEGGGLSDDDVASLMLLGEDERRDRMGALYRRFTDQLMETLRQMGAP